SPLRPAHGGANFHIDCKQNERLDNNCTFRCAMFVIEAEGEACACRPESSLSEHIAHPRHYRHQRARGEDDMATKQDQMNELQKKNLEAAMRLAQMSIENSQRIMELQVSTAKTLFEDGVKNAKAMSAVKDPKELMEIGRAH